MAMTYDLNLREYWRTIRKRKVIVIYTIVMLTAFSFISAILGRPVPLYKTSASVKVEQMGSVTGLYLQAVSRSSTNYMETQMAMIKSYFILELAAKKLGKIPANLSSEEVRNNPAYLSIILDLRNRIETAQEGHSGIITISASSEDPREAQHLANTVAQVYQERHALELNKRVIEAKKFIEEQLALTGEKLQESEEAIRDFREQHRMVSLDAQSSALVGQYTALKSANERHQTTLARINQVAKLLDRAEDRPLTSKTVFYFEEASTPYRQLNDRLVQLMIERDLLLINYTDDFPQVIEIKKQIHEIVTGLGAQLQAQKQNLSQTIDLTDRQLQQLDEQLQTLPGKGLELARLEREVAMHREIFSLLSKQHQESQIQHAETIEEIQIVKPALEPSNPVNPPKTTATTALGLLIGIVLGVVFAFIIETFDTSIGDVEDLEEFLGTRVLGIVPQVDMNDLKATFTEKLSRDVSDNEAKKFGRMISHFAPKTTAAESFRALRTNINFVNLEKGTKTIVVTSSSPQEGKTIVSVNLAIAMAQSGLKVLLIDGDFRRPVISKIFGISAIPGLTDAILGNYKWRDLVRSITDLTMGQMTMDELMATPGLDNLFILTCGTISPNPAELVGTKINRGILAEAHEAYDVVIIDAPPVLAAADAAIWATIADGTILVYQVGKIARGALKRAKVQIDNVKARIIGVVLNGLKAEISPGFEYHEKYDYYYGSERKMKLTLGQRIAALPKRVRRYAGAIPGEVKSAAAEETIGEEKPRSVEIASRSPFKSRLLKILLLLIALSLLVVALYYSFMMTQFIESPLKPLVGFPTPPPSPPPPDAVIVSAPPPKAEVPNDPGAATVQKPYMVQVRATQDERIARETLAALKTRGHNAFMETIDLPGKGVWHRIFIGRFASETEARQYVEARGITAVYPDFIVRQTPEGAPENSAGGKATPAKAPQMR
jgi:tyrosine-protein kinase Etk/Wzc